MSLFAPEGVEWLRMLVGIAVFLAPGFAAADRFFPTQRAALVLAPIFSYTTLSVAAFLLDHAIGMPIHPITTAMLALALTLAFGWPRIDAMLRREHTWSWPRIDWQEAGLLVLVVAFVMFAHSLPHLPGDEGGLPGLAERAADGLQGGTPYPVHVDEHIHMAFMAQLDRQQTVDIDNPYTQEASAQSLFSISGLRTERGFTTAIVQVHHLTDLDLPALFRFLPAIQAGVLAATVWFAVRPGLMPAAFTAIIPTTVRFLGPGFLVPSSFGIAWVFATLAVAQKATGGRRFIALVLLITGATAMHIVLGTLAIVTAIAATAVRQAPLRDRMELLAAALTPLLWILPALWSDAVAAVQGAHLLPFNTEIFLRPGYAVLALSVGGAWLAWREAGRESMRAVSLVALFTLILAVGSVVLVHRNDATYSRILPTLFACLGILAAEPLALLGRTLVQRAPRPKPAQVAQAAAGIAALLVLMPALDAQMQEPLYRVFDDASWARVEAFAASDAGPEDVFLAEPWQAPVLNALTGARPHAVLYPGNPPVNGADFRHYVVSEGADAQWLAERGLDFVVDPTAPNAPHAQVGQGVHRVLSSDAN